MHAFALNCEFGMLMCDGRGTHARRCFKGRSVVRSANQISEAPHRIDCAKSILEQLDGVVVHRLAFAAERSHGLQSPLPGSAVNAVSVGRLRLAGVTERCDIDKPAHEVLTFNLSRRRNEFARVYLSIATPPYGRELPVSGFRIQTYSARSPSAGRNHAA